MDVNYRITPLEESHARDILGWRYPTPYDFYDPPADDQTERYVRAFLEPDLQFHAVLDGDNDFIGFCSFGLDGQVPGGDYSEDALDIGVGMKPELTGQGRGFDFFHAILSHAQDSMSPQRVRLTVASFNRRALRLYERFGFERYTEFADSQYKVPYIILTLDNVGSGNT